MGECDVLVVGAGPVGLIAGLLLVNQGLKVTVIERDPGINPSPRALVYHPQVQGTLEEAGILDDVRKAGRLNRGGIVWRRASDHSALGTMDPSALQPEDKPREDLRVPVLLGQHKVAEILLERFQEKGGLILFDHTFESLEQKNRMVHVITADAQKNKHSFTASFVIGADGGRSSIRKALGERLEGYTHDTPMMAINLRYAQIRATGFTDAQFLVDPKEHAEDSAFAVIIHTGMDDIWRCAYVDGAQLSDDELKARVPIKLKMMLPLHPDEGDYEILQAQPYRVHQRCATSFTKGRVLLAGDAAHLNNPVGGLGLNTGLLDASVATKAIVDAMKMSDEAAVEKRLKEYSDVRREAFLGFTNPVSVDNLRRAIEVSDEAEEKLRTSYFASLQDPEFQREMQLDTNKMGLGVPGL